MGVPKNGKTAFQDLTGRVFGKLTVLGKARTRIHPKGVRSTYFLCRCECGIEKEVSSAALRKGRTESCGATPCRGISLRGAAGFVLSAYKHSAKENGLEFALTLEQVAQLTQSTCHYCNRPPSRMPVKTWVKKAYPEFRWNGIDRVDSSQGYRTENVVPCCYTCNRAKSDMGTTEFLEWVKTVYQHSIARAARAS